MANTRKLLLPYAYDSKGNLVYIDNAHKGETYKCPECGATLTLYFSRIPKGQKYHRRNHFSHSKGNLDNQCTESFLHKLFKKRAVECIQEKMNNGSVFNFIWDCEECHEQHCGNMLKKAKFVRQEYDMGVCRPDIALFDTNGKVVIVIEVVITHKPTTEVMNYYNNHKIACLQIEVSDFDDCEKVEEKLAHPDKVNLCPTPTCKICGNKMHRAKMVILNDSCWKCHQSMKIAVINTNYLDGIYPPEYFTKKEIELANKNGALVKKIYSKQTKESYFANTCKHCNAFIGKFHMSDYYYSPNEKEIDLGYKCYDYYCMEMREKTKISTNWKEIYELKLQKKLQEDGIKKCPICGGLLCVRTGLFGYFYGCKNYPKCDYTENISLID